MPRPWFERRFVFDHLTGADLPVVVERLRGTAARIEDKLREVPRERVTRREGDSWSIQEHVGHLVDLDALHDGRLDDYRAGAALLRPADLQNRKTHEARHNERELGELLRAFRDERGRFVERLDSWEPRLLSATAIHPRLQQPMRVVDMAWFVAEHDDHHLARMTELLRRQL
ncbi:MAG TPA: DinB family protein [Vicinamibacteria bacterium]|nr:DinB family protein [Vicinamibacteria bacterium]